MELFNEHGKLKRWPVFKTEYNLNNAFCFHWLKLNDATQKAWRNFFKIMQTIMAPP